MNAHVDLQQLAIDREPRENSRLRPRRHLLTRYVLPLVLISGFLSLIAWAGRDAFFPPLAVTVVPVFSTTAEVRSEGTPLFQAAGWIEPRPTPVRVAALAPGVVEKLLVVEDQPVEAGEPLAELFKEDSQLALDRALADQRLRNAEVDEAKATLTAATTRLNQPVHLEAALSEAEAALAKLESQLKNLPFEIRRAKADYEALRKDYEGKRSAKGVVAAIAIDIARGKSDSGAAFVEELQIRLESIQQERAALARRRDALQTQLKLLADETRAKDEAAARLKAAEARVAQADVAVAEANLQLNRMTITAPMSGRVFRLVAHPGARVGSDKVQSSEHDGSTVVTMYDPQRLQIRVDVRFEDIPKVMLQQPVEISNPVLSSPLTGRVLFISSQADIQKNTLEVKVEISDPSPLLRPEMLVEATFLAPRNSDREAEPAQELKLYAPRPLVQQDESVSFVWIADQSEGIARKVRIDTGTAGDKEMVEIRSGLSVSSRIISSGIGRLHDGLRIRVLGEDRSFDVNPAQPGSRALSRLPQEHD